MKKILKVFLIIILVIAVILAIGGLYINYSKIPSYDIEAPDVRIEGDSSIIAEGARMASMMCAQCHRSDDGKLGGAYLADVKVFGDIYASNITQHEDYGITNYSDGELVRLLRTGVRKDGRFIPPYMPKYPHLSDEDLNSVIAFLRSDHAMVQPSDNNPPISRPSFLTKFLSRVAFKALPYPDHPIPPPDTNDLVVFGKYLSTAKFDCYSCHSKDFKTVDIMVPENSEGFFGGGNKLLDRDGNEVFSPNLTMDEKTGLGKWSKKQFVEAVRNGIRPDQTTIGYPMAPFTAMTDKEVAAIWAYLKRLPEIHNPEG